MGAVGRHGLRGLIRAERRGAKPQDRAADDDERVGGVVPLRERGNTAEQVSVARTILPTPCSAVPEARSPPFGAPRDQEAPRFSWAFVEVSSRRDSGRIVG